MPSGEKEKHTRVAQISNISPSASREQIHHMFGYLGHIDEMKVYPTETNPLYANAQSKLCYIKFEDSSAVAAAQHMTNTVFIDRALICVPVPEGRIPDEETALKTGGPALPGQRQLPPNVINQIQLVGAQQLMVTIDPTLASLGLSDYPPLPANTDATKIEEIRRTIYVGNIAKESKQEELLDFFNDKIGEVMYLRMAGGEDLPVRYAYIEFTSQHSVVTALQNNGIEFNGNKLRIQHSTVSIMKPRAKTDDMAKKEVEEAVKKAEAANPMITKGVDSSDELLRRFAESRSPSRKRSRSRLSSDRYERRRSSRSRSPARKRSSRSSRRSRSRSPYRRTSPRSRSKDKKRKSRSRSKDRRTSSKKRSRSKSDDNRRRSEKDKDKDKDKDKEKTKSEESRSKKEKRDRSKEKVKETSSSSAVNKESSSKHSTSSSSKSSADKEKDKDRKSGSSSSSTRPKTEEKRIKIEKEDEFKEPDVVGESKNEKEKKSRHYRNSSSSGRRNRSSTSPPKAEVKVERKSRSRSPSYGVKSELDTSKSISSASPQLNTSTGSVEKPAVSSIAASLAATADDDSFVDELLEKTHVKKEKRKKEKKEKRKKKEKSSKKKKTSSGDEEEKNSVSSFDDE